MTPRISIHRLSLALDNPILSRFSPLPVHRIPSSTFSTASCRLAPPLKKAKVAAHQAAGPKKGRKTLKIKKDAPPPDPTIGSPEERKAFKTRIVLSNTNANDVDNIQTLSTENMFLAESIGKVFKLPDAIVDSLRTVGAFKRGQGWNNYRRPSILMTQEAWDIGQAIKQSTEAGGESSALRKVLVGERKCGKSTLLLQIMSMAFLHDWVVINIPEGLSTSTLLS